MTAINLSTAYKAIEIALSREKENKRWRARLLSPHAEKIKEIVTEAIQSSPAHGNLWFCGGDYVSSYRGITRLGEASYLYVAWTPSFIMVGFSRRTTEGKRITDSLLHESYQLFNLRKMFNKYIDFAFSWDGTEVDKEKCRVIFERANNFAINSIKAHIKNTRSVNPDEIFEKIYRYCGNIRDITLTSHGFFDALWVNDTYIFFIINYLYFLVYFFGDFERTKKRFFRELGETLQIQQKIIAKAESGDEESIKLIEKSAILKSL